MDPLRRNLTSSENFANFFSQLSEIKLTMHQNCPTASPVRVAQSQWRFVDESTQIYNCLTLAYSSFLDWNWRLDNLLLQTDALPSDSAGNLVEFGRILQDFKNIEISLSEGSIVMIHQKQIFNMLVSEANVLKRFQHSPSDDIDGLSASSLTLSLKQSILMNRDGNALKERLEEEKLRKCWISNSLIEEISWPTARKESIMLLYNHLVLLWNDYMTDMTPIIMNLICSQFVAWTDDHNAEHCLLNSKMIQYELKSFYSGLEDSMHSDRECENSYKLILEELRSLGSMASKRMNSKNEVTSQNLENGELAKKIGKIALERQLMRRVLEKFQEMKSSLSDVEKRCHEGDNACVPYENQFQRNKERVAVPTGKREDLAKAKRKNHTNCSKAEENMCENVALVSAVCSQRLPEVRITIRKQGFQREIKGEDFCRTDQKFIDNDIKDNIREPRAKTIATPVRNLYEDEMELPMDVADKSIGEAQRNRIGLDYGYVIILRPTLRQRIISIYDTAKERNIHIEHAIKKGIAGFEGVADESAEKKLTFKEQKRLFYLVDTAKGQKLSFSEAIRSNILLFDTCSNEDFPLAEFSSCKYQKDARNPLVYRIESILEELCPKEKEDSQKWLTFDSALNRGIIDKATGDIVIPGGRKKHRMRRFSLTKAIWLGIVKATALRHCLIERLPKERCIYI